MGIKRKIEEIEEKSVSGQRQSILDISMLKLQTHPVRRVEPSLLRSVLILNTLKHIESELHKEGVSSDYSEAATTTLNESSDIALDVLPDVDHSKSENAMQQDFNDMHIDISSSYSANNSVGNDEFKSTNMLSPVQAFSSKDSTSPLPPIESFVELSNAFSSSSSANCMTNVKASLSEGLKDSSASPFDSLSYQDCKPFKTEDMLSDLDISHCDFDIFSSIASSMKLTPLSAEEVLHSFPVHSSVIQESYPQVFSSVSSCKSDLLPEELDNIMQILVGT